MGKFLILGILATTVTYTSCQNDEIIIWNTSTNTKIKDFQVFSSDENIIAESVLSRSNLKEYQAYKYFQIRSSSDVSLRIECQEEFAP